MLTLIHCRAPSHMMLRAPPSRNKPVITSAIFGRPNKGWRFPLMPNKTSRIGYRRYRDYETDRLLNRLPDTRFREVFIAVARFVETHGRVPVIGEICSTLDIDLGKWCKVQRGKRRAGPNNLTKLEEMALESLTVMDAYTGRVTELWQWDVYNDTWEDKYFLCVRYFKVYGRLPRGGDYFEGVYLGDWMSTQLAQYKEMAYYLHEYNTDLTDYEKELARRFEKLNTINLTLEQRNNKSSRPQKCLLDVYAEQNYTRGELKKLRRDEFYAYVELLGSFMMNNHRFPEENELYMGETKLIMWFYSVLLQKRRDMETGKVTLSRQFDHAIQDRFNLCIDENSKVHCKWYGPSSRKCEHV